MLQINPKADLLLSVGNEMEVKLAPHSLTSFDLLKQQSSSIEMKYPESSLRSSI